MKTKISKILKNVLKWNYDDTSKLLDELEVIVAQKESEIDEN